MRHYLRNYNALAHIFVAQMDKLAQVSARQDTLNEGAEDTHLLCSRKMAHISSKGLDMTAHYYLPALPVSDFEHILG